MPPPLFLDLDGVLADFDAGVLAVTGRRPDDLPSAAMWRALAGEPDFYGMLEPMPDAWMLWQFCAPHAPTILTGVPRGIWASEQKRRWVAQRLGADVPVITCMARDKHRHAIPGAVLVDDRESARVPWETVGGIFVRHTSAGVSIAALKDIGF